MIGKREKENIRDQLLDRRKQLVKQVQSVEERLATLERSRPAEFSEESQEEGAAMTLKVLGDHERQELDGIERALVKLDHDTYGICEQCKQAIPMARLTALPVTRFCIRCEEARESS